MTVKRRSLKVGDVVVVPWGIAMEYRAKVIDVWGDPPTHVRVRFLTDDWGDDLPPELLLSPTLVTPA